MEVAFEDVLAAVKQRDYQDTHRAAAPLKQADDAEMCIRDRIYTVQFIVLLISCQERKT